MQKDLDQSVIAELAERVSDIMYSVPEHQRHHLVAQALLSGFTWSETPQGSQYWDNIYMSMLKLSATRDATVLYRDLDRLYTLKVVATPGEPPRFTAGCRNFAAEDALRHWGPDSPRAQPAYVEAINKWLIDNGQTILEGTEPGAVAA